MQPLQYAGDITPEQTWEYLKTDPRSLLLDVRTPEEWTWVGIPDISQIGREMLFIPWQMGPKMEVNPHFVEIFAQSVKPEDDRLILIICRSGVRSAYGADALTRSGYAHCYNVAFGFEGDRNEHKQRGHKNGWKVSGLPWQQG